MRGRIYNRAKKNVGEHSGNQYTEVEKDQIDPIPTAERLAKEHGVSPATIKRDGAFARDVDKLKEVEPERTVRNWLSRIDKDAKEERDKRNRKIFDMWLACHGTDEIAAACDCGKATISEICSKEFLETLSNKPTASHATDFDPPIYNVRKIQRQG